MGKTLILFFLFSQLVFAQNEVANLLSINFGQKGNLSEIELLFDRNTVKANKFEISQDKQIIIDLKNVTSTDRITRDFDTSEFNGPIVFVSAYKKPGPGNDIRVALQLRDNVRSVLKRKENRVVLEVENRFGVFNQNQMESAKKNTVASQKEEENLSRLNIPKSDSVEDILENLTLSGRKKYIGKRITLNVQNLAVEDILRMVAEASGFNIILTDELKKLKPLTLNLTNVPWDQVLDTILGLNKLVAKKNGIILMIQTLESATADKKKEEEAKLLSQKQEPLVTKVFLVSYAKTVELSPIITKYLTPERGSLSEDARTNSLIIKDTPDTIEKIRKIIETLDLQTPQVLIESKIVEVNERYTRQIGLQNGLNFGYDPIGQVGDQISTVGGDNIEGTDFGPGFSLSTAPDEASRSVFGLAIGRFGRLLNLDFTLQLMESEYKGKIISIPKIVTQNNKKAVLEAIKTDSFIQVTTVGEAIERSPAQIEATVRLNVTPKVTNEGSIDLEIEIRKEDFAGKPFDEAIPNKVTSDVKTSVLVDNGSTIVLGGLYEYSKTESHSGIPFLKDIPLVGWLFRTFHNPATQKREVIIFITPRIINQEEAGIINEEGNG